MDNFILEHKIRPLLSSSSFLCSNSGQILQPHADKDTGRQILGWQRQRTLENAALKVFVHLGHHKAGLAHELAHVLWYDRRRRRVLLAARDQVRHGVAKARALPERAVDVHVVRRARKWFGRIPPHLLRTRFPLPYLCRSTTCRRSSALNLDYISS